LNCATRISGPDRRGDARGRVRGLPRTATKVVAVRSGEIAVAALTQIAYFAVDSDVSSSPTKKRQFCDAVAKRLFNLIGEMRHEIAEGGSHVTVIGEPPHAGRSN
jgi:hypothetical protein